MTSSDQDSVGKIQGDPSKSGVPAYSSTASTVWSTRNDGCVLNCKVPQLHKCCLPSLTKPSICWNHSLIPSFFVNEESTLVWRRSIIMSSGSCTFVRLFRVEPELWVFICPRSPYYLDNNKPPFSLHKPHQILKGCNFTFPPKPTCWYDTRLRTAPQLPTEICFLCMPTIQHTPSLLIQYCTHYHFILPLPWASNTRDCAFQLPIKNESICPEGCPLHRQCE